MLIYAMFTHPKGRDRVSGFLGGHGIVPRSGVRPTTQVRMDHETGMYVRALV